MSEQNRKKTILVVEDEFELRSLILVTLERAGFRSLEAADAREAESVWSTVPNVDLLVSDIWLPGDMSGIDLAAQLRYQKPDLKVIFISGLNPRPSTKETSLMGQTYIIRKPFTQATLLELVQTTLQSTS